MSEKRGNHLPEFKSKVALAAIKGDQTLSELSRQYGIDSHMIVKWKKQLIEQSSEIFASGKGLAPDRESEIRGLRAKVGHGEKTWLKRIIHCHDPGGADYWISPGPRVITNQNRYQSMTWL